MAPSVLSIRENPEEAIPLFASINKYYHSGKSVNIDLRDVAQVDQDAVLLLLACAAKFSGQRLGFQGNMPRSLEARKQFRKSGFFDDPNEGKVKEGYSAKENFLVTHGKTSVQPAMTADLMKRAAEVVWGAKAYTTAVQGIFVELMHNTNNHASPLKRGEKDWWISVTLDRQNRRAKFVFADLGIGVIKSLNQKQVGDKFYDIKTRAFTVFSSHNPAFYLKLILDRRLHQTVTAKQYRGKGLPSIKTILDRNGITNLLIVTNNVRADVSGDRYTSMGCSLEGTLVSWEIHESNTCLYET